MLVCLHELLNRTVVFVLPRTVVCVEVNVFLPKAVLSEEVVNSTHDSIGTLSTCLICEKVNLSWNIHTINPKYSAFPWS